MLIALGAEIVLTSQSGSRTIPLDEFFVDYLHSKGRDGASINEGLAAFNEAVARDPQSWPVPPDRLEALWRNTWRVLGAKLPPLARPAQLVWLGTEAGYDNAIIDAALAQEFRTFTPFDAAKAYREAGAHMQREATGPRNDWVHFSSLG